MTKQEYTKTLFGTIQTEIVELLNYSNIIVIIQNNDRDIANTYYWLKKDSCSHMHYFNNVIKTKMFCIENCDLINVSILDNHTLDNYILCDISFTPKGFILTAH